MFDGFSFIVAAIIMAGVDAVDFFAGGIVTMGSNEAFDVGDMDSDEELYEMGKQKKSKSSGNSLLPILLMGIWLVVLTVVFVLYMMKTPNQLDERIEKLEARSGKVTGKIGGAGDASQLAALEKRLGQVEKQLQNLSPEGGKASLSGPAAETIMQRLDKLESAVFSSNGQRQASASPAAAKAADQPDGKSGSAESEATAADQADQADQKRSESKSVAAKADKAKPRKSAGKRAKKPRYQPRASKTVTAYIPPDIGRRSPGQGAGGFLVNGGAASAGESGYHRSGARPGRSDSSLYSQDYPLKEQGSSLYHIGKRYAPQYGVSKEKSLSLSKQAPGLAIYANRRLEMRPNGSQRLGY